MRLEQLTINKIPSRIYLSDTFIDEKTDYSAEFDMNEDVGSEVTLKEIYRLEITGFYPKLHSKYNSVEKESSSQFANLFELSRVVNNSDGSIRRDNIVNNHPKYVHLLDNNTTGEVNFGSGPVMVGHFDMFKYLAENGQLSLFEHIINGYFLKLTRDKKLFGKDNPLFIDRTYQTSYTPAEPFKADHTLRQPLIAKVVDIAEPEITGSTESVTGITDASITIQVADFAGVAEYSTDGGSTFTQVPASGEFRVDSLAPSAEYTIIVKDANEEPITFVVPIGDPVDQTE